MIIIKRGAVIMKKKCITITFVTFAILFLLTFVMPKEITVNGGIGKKADISVYSILLLSPIPALCYWSHDRKKRRK